MTLFIRRYQKSDIPAILQLAHQMKDTKTETGGENYFSKFRVSDEKLTQLLEQNVNNIRFFLSLIVGEDDKPVGGLMATVTEVFFSRDTVAKDLSFFLLPEARQVNVTKRLIEQYVEWANNRGVVEVQLANSTGIEQERFGKLMTRSGFRHFMNGYSKERES